MLAEVFSYRDAACFSRFQGRLRWLHFYIITIFSLFLQCFIAIWIWLETAPLRARLTRPHQEGGLELDQEGLWYGELSAAENALGGHPVARIPPLMESGVLGRTVVGVRIYSVAECFAGRFAGVD